MQTLPFHLKRAGSLVRGVDDDGVLSAVFGAGGGCTLELSGAATVVCIPLHGLVELRGNAMKWSLLTGDVLVAECSVRATVVGTGNSRWLALLGGPAAWARVLPQADPMGGQLLPGLYGADRRLRRRAIAVARAAAPVDLEAATNVVADKLTGVQASLRDAILRCPGRTWANRRQVFLRLQRVRNHMCVYCDHELDLDVLARMANYSPCHFLRTFGLVFGMTPHAYLIDQRLRRAWRLLRYSDMAVTEVAVASGFENRSAFSRLFHQRFGMTAVDAKRKREIGPEPVVSAARAA